jgi:hypothetical protein
MPLVIEPLTFSSRWFFLLINLYIEFLCCFVGETTTYRYTYWLSNDAKEQQNIRIRNTLPQKISATHCAFQIKSLPLQQKAEK